MLAILKKGSAFHVHFHSIHHSPDPPTAKVLQEEIYDERPPAHPTSLETFALRESMYNEHGTPPT